MIHIPHQQTWNHPFMWDVQMAKPCNQLNPVYSIYHPYMINHMRDKYYPSLHTVFLYQLEISVVLDAQFCSNHSKLQ